MLQKFIIFLKALYRGFVNDLVPRMQLYFCRVSTQMLKPAIRMKFTVSAPFLRFSQARIFNYNAG